MRQAANWSVIPGKRNGIDGSMKNAPCLKPNAGEHLGLNVTAPHDHGGSACGNEQHSGLCQILANGSQEFRLAGHEFPYNHRRKNYYPDQIRPAAPFLKLFRIYH